jgi:hypothetical protein
MRQVSRTLTATDGLGGAHRVLICDRDRKWSWDVRQLLGDAGVHVVQTQTPFQAPNANAYAERFVRSIKRECLDRMVPLGERHFRRALKEFVDHYIAVCGQLLRFVASKGPEKGNVPRPSANTGFRSDHAQTRGAVEVWRPRPPHPGGSRPC